MKRLNHLELEQVAGGNNTSTFRLDNESMNLYVFGTVNVYGHGTLNVLRANGTLNLLGNGTITVYISFSGADRYLIINAYNNSVIILPLI